VSRKTILLVDDSETILAMEKFILRDGPYDLVTASNGVDAVTKAVELVPDLILLDVIMPKMGGLEARRRIRAVETTRSIPIIMITTPGEASHVETSPHVFDDYVTKPINTIELLSKVRGFLDEIRYEVSR